MYGTLGQFDSTPPEVEDANWVLREQPLYKANLSIDWRINPAFCMDPFPVLPWKNDWTTADRTRSIRSYPLSERPTDAYTWKSDPGEYLGYQATKEAPGTDYLFAYWFGRLFGSITADM